MTPVLHIVSQCTDRKKLAVGKKLRLRSIRTQNIDERAEAWCGSLRRASEKTAARDLYAGEHWVATLELEAIAKEKGLSPRLWVLSAGLGLIDADEMVPAYSATFSSDSPDSVVLDLPFESRLQRRAWFNVLSRRNKAGLETLKDCAKNDRFLFVLSRPYVQAVFGELVELRDRLADPRHLLIVTGEAPELEGSRLEENWVPSSSRLASIIGGTKIGQHARLARALLDELPTSGLRSTMWRERVQQWLARAPELVAYDRKPMTDADVRRFARRAEASSWSKALRELRDSGRACEQKRFRRLFTEERAP